MQVKMLTTLVLSLVIFVGCSGKAQVRPAAQAAKPSPSVEPSRDLTADEVQQLCNRVAEIKVLPMKEERGVDSTYDAFMTAGVRVVPCLIEKVTDETPIKDPRQAPTYSDTRLGDIAVFLIGDITQLDFFTLLPLEVQAKVPNQGVYAYFAYVEKPKHRKTLQDNLRVWFKDNFADAAAQKSAAGGHQ